MSFPPVSSPIASPPLSSSNNYMKLAYPAPALTFILVFLLPIVYCLLWCTIHIVIVDLQRRRQSASTTSEPPALPLQVFVQPGQQHQQVSCIDIKVEPNPECPICLEEEAEAEAEAKTEADAEMEALSWQLVPECNHRFHEFCLKRWLKLSQTCPLCRVTTQLEACLAVV